MSTTIPTWLLVYFILSNAITTAGWVYCALRLYQLGDAVERRDLIISKATR